MTLSFVQSLLRRSLASPCVQTLPLKYVLRLFLLYGCSSVFFLLYLKCNDVFFFYFSTRSLYVCYVCNFRSTSRYADLEKPKKKKTLSATTSLVSIPNTIKLSMLNSGLISFGKFYRSIISIALWPIAVRRVYVHYVSVVWLVTDGPRWRRMHLLWI